MPADATITIPTNCSLEVLAAQLQPFTDKFLYVVDDVVLNYYSSLDEVPPGPRRLEPATPLGFGQMNYYIRDLAQKQLICCFDSDLCHRLIESIPGSTGTLKKSESNPDLTTRTIRIVTQQRPEQVASEPKAQANHRADPRILHPTKLHQGNQRRVKKIINEAKLSISQHQLRWPQVLQ